jgi:DeoR/GlpR family transcriptional regulator of sugar metabolism
VILCPGDYVLREGGVYGPDTVEFIRRFKANKAFIGAGGVTAEGVTDADSLSCSVKRAMMERSDRTVLLVDSSKYDLVQFERVSPLSGIDQLVCDTAPPKRLLAGPEEGRRRGDRCETIAVNPELRRDRGLGLTNSTPERRRRSSVPRPVAKAHVGDAT